MRSVADRYCVTRREKKKAACWRGCKWQKRGDEERDGTEQIVVANIIIRWLTMSVELLDEKGGERGHCHYYRVQPVSPNENLHSISRVKWGERRNIINCASSRSTGPGRRATGAEGESRSTSQDIRPDNAPINVFACCRTIWRQWLERQTFWNLFHGSHPIWFSD